MPEAKSANVTLRVELVERKAEQLTLHYVVHNESSKPVWLFNVLFDTDLSGVYRLNPNKVYGQLDEDGLMTMGKQLLAVPPGVMVEFPEIPCVSKLEPGAKAEETLRVMFPFKENSPYQFEQRRLIQLAAVKQLSFALGYFEDDPAVHFLNGKDGNGKPFTYPRYGEVLARQIVITAGTFKIN